VRPRGDPWNKDALTTRWNCIFLGLFIFECRSAAASSLQERVVPGVWEVRRLAGSVLTSQEALGAIMVSEIVKANVEIVFGLGTKIGLKPLSEDTPKQQPPGFSVFRKEDATRAAELAERLMVIAEDKGLDSATAFAAEVSETNPGLARHALGIFSTHSAMGRNIRLPSLLRRTAAFAARTAAKGEEVTLGSKSTGEEVALDWFREDPLANEHHEHWHIVYPNRVAPARIKQRHGELFYYMHQQMLARYDVERLSAGLKPVAPLADLRSSLGSGYDPGQLETSYLDYEPREPGKTMAGDLADLILLDERLARAASTHRLGPAGEEVLLEGHQGSNLLGLEAESTSLQRFEEFHGNHHGDGHGHIAAASVRNTNRSTGVMADTATAIRDPAFWRWHRHIDDIHFSYQDSLDPHTFDEQLDVQLKGISLQPEESDSPAGPGSDELRTFMRSGRYKLTNEKTYKYDFLSHEPFQFRVDLQNTADGPRPVTLRVFLLPSALFSIDADPTTVSGRQMRRFAIELDKVKIDVPAGEMSFVRKGRDSSVIRRPAVVDPGEVADIEGGDQSATAECTCGWPFGLLVPRGTVDGMHFKLFAMLTDNAADRIGSPKKCGSMSFCGVGDQYPDAKPMGYPFDRRLTAPLGQLVATNPTMALRDVSIHWQDAVG